LVVLASLVGPACGPPAEAAGPDDVRWRRTRYGWEPRERVVVESPLPSPGLHPATVAAMEALVAAFALAAFPGKDRRKADGPA
jgi:hypothetical protein